MKLLLLISLAIVVALIAIEITLWAKFGFGDPLLYVADPDMGYRLAPDQLVNRFGNVIRINSVSMRGQEVGEYPASHRVLMLGDSILNGGWWTDEPDTLSFRLSARWNGDVEFLNASANSWGPRNELAYLKRFGTFNAEAIVLVLNTDDLFAAAPSSLGVGRDRNYPDRKPASAISEVITRYLLPAPKLPAQLKEVQAEGGDRVGVNLAAVREIAAIAERSNAKFLMVMTPLLREVEKPGPRNYEQVARQRLLEFTKTHRLTYIDFLPSFAQNTQPKALYRDHIHLSPTGNQLIGDRINDQIRQWFKP